MKETEVLYQVFAGVDNGSYRIVRLKFLGSVGDEDTGLEGELLSLSI